MAASNKTMKMTMEFVGEDKVSKVTSAVGKNLRKVTKQMEKNQGILGDAKAKWALYAAGVNGALGIANTLFGTVQAGFDAAMNAAKSLAIESAFKKAFPDADALVEKLREASGFQIDTTSLQRLAREGKTAGLSAAQLAETLELSVKAANALGMDAAESASKIINSYTKMTGEGLESLKVRIKMGEVMADHRVRLGLLGDKMTKNQETEAMHLAIVEALGHAYGDIEIKDTPFADFGKVKADYDDLTKEIGQGWMEMVVWAATGSDRLYNLMAASAESSFGILGLFDERAKQFLQTANDIEGIRARDEAHMERRAYLVKYGMQNDLAAFDLRQKEIAQRQALGDAYDEMNAQEREDMIQQDQKIAQSEEAVKANYKKALSVAKLAKTLGDQAALTGDAQLAVKKYTESYKFLLSYAGADDQGPEASWKWAAHYIGQAAGQLELWNRKRITWLADQARARNLTRAEAEELKKLRGWMEKNSDSIDFMFEIQNPEERMRGFSEATKQAVQQQARQAMITASNAAETARAAIATGNYKIAITAASTAWSQGETAGEDYRIKNEQIRDALIESTKAQLSNARAIYETMEAEAALGAMRDPAFGASMDATRAKIRQLEVLSEKLSKIGVTKKPKGPKAKSALIDLAKEEADAIAEIREGIFIKEETQRGVDRMRELWSPPSWMKGADEIRIYAEEQARAIAEGLNLTWDQVGSAMLAESDALTDGYIETLDRQRDAMAAFAADVQASQQESFSNAISFAGQFGNHWSAAMGQSLGVMEHQYQKWQVMQKAISSGAISQGEAYAKAAPGMIAAGGQVAAAFIQDEQAKAAVLAAMEAAASVVAFAPPVVDVVGGTMHALAASMYTAIAAGAFKGSSTRGGGGGAARKPPAAIAPRAPDQDTGSTNQITLNFSGTVVGSDDSAGRALAALLRREMKWQAPIESSGAM